MGKKLLVTGGAGFIGSNFVHYWLKNHPEDEVINLDALTYAGTESSLTDIQSANYRFVHGSINDRNLIEELMHGVHIVVHFAAESHVDRSISNPEVFLQTNIMGTFELLNAAVKAGVERFHHISTDEVFGSLELSTDQTFDEHTPYDPRSPYSASKAGSDHLVRAFGETYHLPFSITNCSNNYGEYHFPEKAIPKAITNLLQDKPIEVYGNGLQVRDWLYVQDHCRAIELIITNPETIGKTYLVGGLLKDTNNLELAKMICRLMNKSETSDITFVEDRPGHDQRYAVNWQKIHQELGWEPSVTLETGLKKTIEWYTQNQWWWQPLLDRAQVANRQNIG